MKYTCNNCEKIFNKKSNYDAHINRKNKCKPITREKIKSELEKDIIFTALKNI